MSASQTLDTPARTHLVRDRSAIPQLARIRQSFPRPRLSDVAAEVRATVSSKVVIRPGARVALAVGSRGIANLGAIVRATAEAVRAMGGEPFVVPAMGSHGGGTAEGQELVLAGYGVTEAGVGCPIRSSMEVVELPGAGGPEYRVFMDRLAYESDGVIVINRIKPHTDFHDRYESGVVKMTVIGLGKAAQATEMHRYRIRGLTQLVPLAAAQIFASGKILLGLGIVENAYDETMVVEAMTAERVMAREPELLAIAAANMPRLPVDGLDVLVVDRMGKDISGVGIDTNIIGRLRIQGQREPESPEIGMIVVTDLTDASHGNATGMGLADLTTRRMFEKIDFPVTNTNVATSAFLDRARLPMVAETDEQALEWALRGTGPHTPESARVIRIRDTLHLDDLFVSPAVLAEISGRPEIELLAPPADCFDDTGALLPLLTAMADLLVVADDLTGATDTGVQFGKRGMPVSVVQDSGGALVGNAGVLVVDSASRHLTPVEAAKRVEDVVRRAREMGTARFFKKTDSTLRGNVGSEIAALLSASGHERLVFVPALPALGRMTRGGLQYVHGRPLHESEFSRDPLEPATESSVTAIVGRQTRESIATISGDALDPASRAELPDTRILVVDASTDDEIRRIAGWMAQRNMLGAVAGTAALASAIAGLEPAAPAVRPRIDGPLLVLGGSLSPVSRQQLRHAAANGFESVDLSSDLLLEGRTSADWERTIVAASGHLADGRDVVLRSAAGEAAVAECLAAGAARGLAPHAVHLRVAGHAGAVASALLEKRLAGALVVLGGDTFGGVIRALGGPALRPRWEALPGIPVSEVCGHDGLLIISKAGGFGPEDVLIQVKRVMMERIQA